MAPIGLSRLSEQNPNEITLTHPALPGFYTSDFVNEDGHTINVQGLQEQATLHNPYTHAQPSGAINKQPASLPQPKSADPVTTQTLPLLLIRTLTNDDVHRCRCPEICEPNFSEKLFEQATERVRQEKGEEIKSEIDRKLGKLAKVMNDRKMSTIVSAYLGPKEHCVRQPRCTTRIYRDREPQQSPSNPRVSLTRDVTAEVLEAPLHG